MICRREMHKSLDTSITRNERTNLHNRKFKERVISNDSFPQVVENFKYWLAHEILLKHFPTLNSYKTKSSQILGCRQNAYSLNLKVTFTFQSTLHVSV